MINLDQPLDCDGGKVVVDRLIRLFGLRSMLELAEVLGMNPGSFSTWKTRNTIPHEILMRVHLATGVSMEYLCFGKGEGVPDVMQFAKNTVPEYVDGKVITEKTFRENEQTESLPSVDVYDIQNGDLIKTDSFQFDEKFKANSGIGSDDFVLKQESQYLFINHTMTTPNQGKYLFSVNGTYQIGELRLLPDGQVYLMLEGDKFPINNDTTKIHGKVVSVLENK
ncbi:MAG: helix-turn-helix domain-containing protein [Parashewanella sp.]